MNQKTIYGGVFGLILLTYGGRVLAQTADSPASQPTTSAFSSARQLHRYFTQRLKEAQRAIETERFIALEKLLKTVSSEERPIVLRSMIETASFLEKFDHVISLSDTYLKEYPTSRELWDIRRPRFDALIQNGQAAQAHKEWKQIIDKLEMAQWQPAFDAGIQIAEGFLDAGKVEEVKAIYDTLRRQLSFVSNIEEVLSPKSKSLDWIGRTPPTLEGNDLQDRRVDLNDYRGKVVLIEFWATWCGPCIAAMPHLIETYEEYHDQGFEIIGISLDSNIKALNQFLEQRQLPWPQMCDGQATYGPNVRKYEVIGIPASFLIDRSGKIARADMPAYGLGPVVRRLLAKPASPKP